jgi:hypothetical protein
MAILQVVTCESFMPYLSAIRPLAQAGMKRAVGATDDKGPYKKRLKAKVEDEGKSTPDVAPYKKKG